MTDLLTRSTRPIGLSPKARMLLMMQFAGDWNYELDDVETVIETVENGDDFAKLFRDVICHDKYKSAWVRHPNARMILRRKLINCKTAYDNVLRFDPDRAEACLEYLGQALARFKTQTRV